MNHTILKKSSTFLIQVVKFWLWRSLVIHFTEIFPIFQYDQVITTFHNHYFLIFDLTLRPTLFLILSLLSWYFPSLVSTFFIFVYMPLTGLLISMWYPLISFVIDYLLVAFYSSQPHTSESWTTRKDLWQNWKKSRKNPKVHKAKIGKNLSKSQKTSKSLAEILKLFSPCILKILKLQGWKMEPARVFWDLSGWNVSVAFFTSSNSLRPSQNLFWHPG